jgi:hypothetical protein
MNITIADLRSLGTIVVAIPNQKSLGITTLFNQTTNSRLQIMATATSAVQGITLPALSQTYRIEETQEIPYDEGMALYYQIKQRHSDLFRELADL